MHRFARLVAAPWPKSQSLNAVRRAVVPLTDTRFKEGKTEFISPTNRFYGSIMFPPGGNGLSKRGYTPDEEGDVLCLDSSKNGCPDPCAYKLCNEGMSFTVQCPDHCYQAAGAA